MELIHSFLSRCSSEASECAADDLVDQSSRGDLRAFRANRGGDGSGTDSHLRLEGVAERLGQRVGGGRAGRVRGSDPEVVDSLSPVVLVVDLGHDDLGYSGLGGYGRGARATVVYCGR